LRARLSLFSSTITFAPKMAYYWRGSRSCSLAAGHSQAGRVLASRATTTRGPRPGGRPAGALAGGGDRPLPTRLGVRGRRAKAAAGKVLRSDRQLFPSAAGGRIEAAEPLGQGKARSASARSVRKRLGCQPRWPGRDGGILGGSSGALAHAPRSRVWSASLPRTPLGHTRPRTGRR
jgi:hypothetical protein